MSSKFHHLQIGNVLSALSKAVVLVAFYLMVPTVATAQNFMSQEELLATIPGGQVSGISNSDGKTRWAQAYSKATSKKKGVYNGLWGKDKYKGEWYVKGDQWCEKGDWGEKCWSIERVGAKELRIYDEGKPKKNTWKLK